jgi:hypothetical protein
VNKNRRESARRFRLPMTMAQNPAAVGGVHFDRLRDFWQVEGRTRQKVTHNRLQVAVGQSAPGHKPSQPCRRIACRVDNHFIFRDLRGHESSASAGIVQLAREHLGRLVGIERCKQFCFL